MEFAMTTEAKPDFKRGFAVSDLAEGSLVAGQVDGEDAVLTRHGEQFFVVGGGCTHYHAALADGLVVGETLRCPLHHACFSLRTGEALHAPALDAIPCWRAELVGDTVYAREKQAAPARKNLSQAGATIPSSVVIIGSGAAGLGAADMLRREGYDGPLTMLSADDSAPYDRPNLSKEFLTGTAPADWMPLRLPDFYNEQKITLVLNARVASIDPQKKRVQLEDGKSYDFGALLIATGSDPVQMNMPGAQPGQLHYLRTFADSRAIVAKAESAKHAAVIGASFIGLEVAASLRSRGIAVEVIAPESTPLERVMGTEVGNMLRKLHEEHGVVFYLGQTVSRVDGDKLTLSGGKSVQADLIVLGVGVRLSLTLAEKAGLAIDRGIAVNEFLETSVPGVFAAGDVARWPDPHSAENIRVEHWVVAERQGQIAAKNMLGRKQPFDAVPFFWSAHYDLTINYIGHAEQWDRVQIDGDLEKKNCVVRYLKGDRTLAVATIGRDVESLRVEAAMESAVEQIRRPALASD
jgi:NADPH-dependent 2,4-dienoyl-CoA reductase/sulfur reductase-like enzyme/nitrite reductase/ring-hydroxylating ferredoxin subunit